MREDLSFKFFATMQYGRAAAGRENLSPNQGSFCSPVGFSRGRYREQSAA